MTETPLNQGNPHDPEAEAPTGRRLLGDHRRVIVLGAVTGVAVLAAASYLLLSPGGSSNDTSQVAAAPVHRVVGATPSASPSASALPSALPAPAGSTGVNPFKALIVPVVATTVPTTSSTSPPTTLATADPTSLPTTQSTADPTAVPTAGATNVKLVSVKADNTQAAVYVSGHALKYVLQRNDRFAVQFQLVSMTAGNCASFLHGEQKFALCEGQSKSFS